MTGNDNIRLICRSIVPRVGSSTPAIRRIRVDLPAPFRPRTATFSPREIVKETPLSTRCQP